MKPNLSVQNIDPSIRKAFRAGLVVGLGHLLFGFSGTVGRPEFKMVEILIQEK